MPTPTSKERDIQHLLDIQDAIKNASGKNMDVQKFIAQKLPLLSDKTRNYVQRNYFNNKDSIIKFSQLHPINLIETVNKFHPLTQEPPKNATANKLSQAAEVSTARTFLSSMHNATKGFFSHKLTAVPAIAATPTTDPNQDYGTLRGLQEKLREQIGKGIALNFKKADMELFNTLSPKTQQVFRTEFLNTNGSFKPGKAEAFLDTGTNKDQLKIMAGLDLNNPSSRSTTPSTDSERTLSVDNNEAAGIRMTKSR